MKCKLQANIKRCWQRHMNAPHKWTGKWWDELGNIYATMDRLGVP